MTAIVRPWLIGPGGLLDDAGHAARAYGRDVLVLVRPDGYIGLIADADDGSAPGGPALEGWQHIPVGVEGGQFPFGHHCHRHVTGATGRTRGA